MSSDDSQNEMREEIGRLITIDSSFAGRFWISRTYDSKGAKKTEDIIIEGPKADIRPTVVYAVLALVFILAAAFCGRWVLVHQDELGTHFAIAYYGPIVVLGLACAYTLFGSLRSYARVSGTHGLAHVEIGGAAALFVIVVAGAYYFGHSPDTFTLTVRLKGAEIDADALSGLQIQIDLDARRESHPFERNGQVNIPGVPESLVGQEVHVELSPGRVHLVSDSLRLPPSHIVYLPVTITPLTSTGSGESPKSIH